jgi:hypothetical protein
MQKVVTVRNQVVLRNTVNAIRVESVVLIYVSVKVVKTVMVRSSLIILSNHL